MRDAPTPETLFDLVVPARPERLRLIRACVAEGAALADLSEEACTDLVQAVDEACQNVIRHGYRGRSDGEIGVTLVRWSDSVEATLTDSAEPIRPDALSPRAIEDAGQGGLGVHVIRACVDRVKVTPRPAGRGNRMTLTKRIG